MLLRRQGDRFPTIRFELRDNKPFGPFDSPEDVATVLAGTTAVLERIEDIDIIENVALFALQQKQPSIFFKEFDSLGSESDLAVWSRRGLELRPLREAILEGTPDTGEETETLKSLVVAIDAIREVWIEAAHREGLNAFLSVLPAASVNQPAIVFASPTPLLELRPGSLLAWLSIPVFYRGARWSLALYGVVRPLFTSATEAANWFVDSLRDRGEHHSKRRPSLPRLDKMSPDQEREIHGSKIIIVLVHGLFSTDTFTFDGFLKAWEERQDTERQRSKQTPSCCLVGFPHDTLGAISINADDLSDLLSNKVAYSDQKILFICHSRGGLVVRAAIQNLLKQGEKKWRDQLLGLVTFGTPHNGAKLARVPGRYLGGYPLLLAGAEKWIAVDMVFTYLRHKRRIDGIDDLAPAGNPVSEFLERLLKNEEKRPLPYLIAIGGNLAAATPRRRWSLQALSNLAISRFIGSRKHDLVVDVESSMPIWAKRKHELSVDHFSYFKPGSSKCVDLAIEDIEALLNSNS